MSQLEQNQEPEVLSYSEYRRRQMLLEWEARRRANDGGEQVEYAHIRPIGWLRQAVQRLARDA